VRAVLLLLLSCWLALPAAAAQRRDFTGTVTHVSDGDTVWVRPATGGAAVPVRLQGIDAPEVCQTFGTQARQALAWRVLNQPVKVEVQGRDDYDRLLGRISLHGQDVGAWLVFTGHAWSYRYRANPGPYAQQEAQARQARRGLWAASGAIDPRQFRKRQGPCH